MSETKPFGESMMAGFRADKQEIEKQARKSTRERKKEALTERTKELVPTQERIAAALDHLYTIVYDAPDKPITELAVECVQQQNGIPLPEEVESVIMSALDAYHSKHSAVRKFHKENPDPAVAFEKCFGVKPVGQVNVIEGPMTLNFQCFSDDDYIAAFMYGESSQGADREKFEQVEDTAWDSGGVALSHVKVPGFDRCVILERASLNREWVSIEKKTQLAEIKDDRKDMWQMIPYPEDSAVIVIKTLDGVYVGEVLTSKHKNDDAMGKVSFLPTSYSRFGASLIEHVDALTDPLVVRVRTPASSKGQYVKLRFTQAGFEIFDHTHMGTEVATMKYGGEFVIEDKNLSKQTQRHEEQHQFNKLFDPNELRDNLFGPESQIKRAGQMVKNNPNRGAFVVAETVARMYRYKKIDTQLRDEVIAMVQEGRAVQTMEDDLLNSDLYQYQKQILKLGDGSGITQENYITNNSLYWTESLFSQEAVDFSFNDEPPTEVELGVSKSWDTHDEQEAMQAVHEVLTTDYEKSVKRALHLIESMRSAGLTNQQIVSYLHMAPFHRWPSFLRRILKYHFKKDGKTKNTS